MLDKKTFFDGVRGSIFPRLSQGQVEGIDAILDCWNGGPEGLFSGAVYDAHLSYMLATVFHETAQTMQAVKEGLQASDHWRKNHLRYYPYYGRGLVQLTWKSNYQKMAQAIAPFYPEAADMDTNLDRALEPKIAVAILFYGMSRGSFTGKSLHTFIGGHTCDFYHARQIINGMDRATLVAGYANKFHKAVVAATKAYGDSPAKAAPAPTDHPAHYSELTLSLPDSLIAKLNAQPNPNAFAEKVLADSCN